MTPDEQRRILAAIERQTERAQTIPGYASRWLIALGTYTMDGDLHPNYGGERRVPPVHRVQWRNHVKPNGNEVFEAEHEGRVLRVESRQWTGKWDATLDGQPVYLFDGMDPVVGFDQTPFPDHIDAMLAVEARLLGDPA